MHPESTPLPPTAKSSDPNRSKTSPEPHEDPLHGFVLARLADLRGGTTMCPGRLARDAGTRLPALRPLLEHMQQAGQVRVTQGGVEVDLRNARGPFRVALPASPLPGRGLGTDLGGVDLYLPDTPA